MKLKLFCALSVLFVIAALLMPVSVYASQIQVNATSDAPNHLAPQLCVSLGTHPNTTEQGTNGDPVQNGSSVEADNSLCGGGGTQLNVSWNSGGG